VRLVALLFLLCIPLLGAWTWPVHGPVLAPFAFDSAHPYAGGQHRGVDIGASAGGTVLAPAGGTVTFAGTVPSSGRSLTILTGDGYDVTLTHLGSLGVAKGATVVEGDAVGTVGPSGTPELDGPYVHLGVRTDANDQGYVDPLGLLGGGAAL
jgi:septal ring factor EnvC (AmiA/AmiB activator)